MGKKQQKNKKSSVQIDYDLFFDQPQEIKNQYENGITSPTKQQRKKTRDQLSQNIDDNISYNKTNNKKKKSSFQQKKQQNNNTQQQLPQQSSKQNLTQNNEKFIQNKISQNLQSQLLCQTHQQKAEYVCTNFDCYNRLICRLCSKKHQETHKKFIKHIQHFSQSLKNSLLDPLVLQNLQSTNQKFSLLQQKCSQYQQEVLDEFQSSMQKIKDKILSYLDKYSQKFINSIQSEYTPLQQNLSDIMQKLNKYESTINKYHDNIEKNQNELNLSFIDQQNLIKLDKKLHNIMLPSYNRCYDQMKSILKLKKINSNSIKTSVYHQLDQRLKAPIKKILDQLNLENQSPNNQNNINNNSNNNMEFRLINPNIQNSHQLFNYSPITQIELPYIQLKSAFSSSEILNIQSQEQEQLESEINQIKFLQKFNNLDLVFFQNNTLKSVNIQAFDSYIKKIKPFDSNTQVITASQVLGHRKILLGDHTGNLTIFDLLKKKEKSPIHTHTYELPFINMQNYQQIQQIIPYTKEYYLIYNKNGYLSLLNIKSNQILKKLKLSAFSYQKDSIKPEITKISFQIIPQRNLLLIISYEYIQIICINRLKLIKQYQSPLLTHYKQQLEQQQKQFNPEKNIPQKYSYFSQIITEKTHTQKNNLHKNFPHKTQRHYLQICFQNRIIKCDIQTGRIIKNLRIPEIDSPIVSCANLNDKATLIFLTQKNELAWYNYMNNTLIGYKAQKGKISNKRNIVYLNDGNRIATQSIDSNKIKILQFSN